MAAIVDVALVERAFDLVRPLLDEAMRRLAPDRAGVAIVVAPTRELYPRGYSGSFRDLCYLVTHIGDLDRSPYPNAEIALSKAEISARTGRPTADLPPQYLLAGDTPYWGSAVVNGVVVACAGLEPRHDEMIAYWLAAAIQAEARKAFTELGELNFLAR